MSTNTTAPTAPKKLDLSKLLAEIKEKKLHLTPEQPETKVAEIVDNLLPAAPATAVPANTTAMGMHGEEITYNSQQQEFINLAAAGKDCVLIGAAGTGKTTCSKGAMQALLANGKIPILNSDGHKHLRSGTPGIIIISYTRRAVNNIRKVQSEDMKNNCITAHKLLEYAPVYYQVEDPETGELKNTMRFEPTRNAARPLPPSIHTIVVEESSMLGTDLMEEIEDALSHPVQWIFIGDIQQLPPVFGPAVLGFRMIELPVIELTEVYRQAMESPIIRLAHRILSGKPISPKEYPEWNFPNQLTIKPWKKKTLPDHAMVTIGAYREKDDGTVLKGLFLKGIDSGLYNPEEDMILIPYNKAFGTLELNKCIANYLARQRQATTYEIMAGFVRNYFSEGDKILYDREDAEIIEILPNPAYSGAIVQPPSKNLDYWGHNPKLAEERAQAKGHAYDINSSAEHVDMILDAVASSDERVNQASHKVIVRLVDSESEIELSSAGEINALLHAYALTVHKAQGSEWRKVFLVLHHSHATMLQRELLYTGVTRAREELYVICEPESFTKGITSQRIKGNTLAEKAEYFKGKVTTNG
jgi:exodeoxyribonuclease V alpha subunit